MSNDDRTRRRFLSGACIAATVGLTGCGSSSEGGQNTTGNQHGDSSEDDSHGHSENDGGALDGPDPEATVAMMSGDDGSHFEPHAVWVERGGTVTWELESGSHTTTAYAAQNDKPERIPDGANPWDSGTLSEQGTTFENAFDTAGVYDYFCVPHEGTGMVGTVVVGNPDPEGQPGLRDPQESLPSGAATKIESLNQRVTEALHGSGETGTESGTHDESGHDHN